MKNSDQTSEHNMNPKHKQTSDQSTLELYSSGRERTSIIVTVFTQRNILNSIYHQMHFQTTKCKTH